MLHQQKREEEQRFCWCNTDAQVSQNSGHVPRNEISRKRIHSDSEETDGPLRKKIKDSRDENAEFIAQAMECNYEGVDELRRELKQGLKTIKQVAEHLVQRTSPYKYCLSKKSQSV